MSLKYLSNFWGLFEVPLINQKIELEHKWIRYCVLYPAGADKSNTNPNNIVFTIKDTKLYARVVTL